MFRGTEKIALISTDKAVIPTHVMGATNHLCETPHFALRMNSNLCFPDICFRNKLALSTPLFKKNRPPQPCGSARYAHDLVSTFADPDVVNARRLHTQAESAHTAPVVQPVKGGK